MRRCTVILAGAVALLVLMAPTRVWAAATPAGTGVTASPHNMNNFGVAVENQEVCRPCHTPHNVPDKTQPALWNHQLNPAASYQLYNTGHSTRFSANYVGLDTESKLCLSCHDGAIAVDNYGGATGGTHFVSGSKAVGKNGDLTDDHPVGLKYPFNADGVTPAGGYNDPAAATFSADGVSGRGVNLVTLPDGSKGVGCSSCHTEHNNTNGDFLRVSNQYSYLCLKCHNK